MLSSETLHSLIRAAAKETNNLNDRDDGAFCFDVRIPFFSEFPDSFSSMAHAVVNYRTKLYQMLLVRDRKEAINARVNWYNLQHSIKRLRIFEQPSPPKKTA